MCACANPPADPPPDDDDGDPAAGTSSTGSAGSETTFGAPQHCTQSTDCAKTTTPYCVAPYDPGFGRIEDASCVAECVSSGELARACIDDDSCCDGSLCNALDGFCTPDATASSSSTGAGTTHSDASSTAADDTSGSSTGASSSSTGVDTER
jgi:hypothetical protein